MTTQRLRTLTLETVFKLENHPFVWGTLAPEQQRIVLAWRDFCDKADEATLQKVLDLFIRE